MAQVPRYDNAQVMPEVVQSRQSSSASPELFNGGNRYLGQAGQGLTKLGLVVDAIQEKEDADKVLQAETAMRERYLEFENEARNRKGQQAWGLAEDTKKWWDTAGQEVAQELSNDRQKALFKRTIGKLRISSLSGMSRYETEQRNISLEESAKASIVSSINLAAANANDPTAVNEAKKDVLKRVELMAQLNGWTPERVAVEQAQHTTNLHKQVIQQMAVNNPKGAAAYYEANKGEIDGAQRAEMEATLQAGKLSVLSQETADQLMASNMTEQDGLDYIRKNFEGDDEKAITAEWKTRQAERTAARERQQRSLADEAWGIYARTGSLNKIPPAILAGLDGKDLMALRKEHEERIARLTKKEEAYPKTDWDKYYELRREAITNPEAFKGRDLRREFPFLGKAEREGLIDLQSKADKPDELKDVATLDQQLSNAKDLLKLGGVANQEKRGKFDQVVMDAVRAEEKRTGKKLSYDERQKIIDKYAMEGTVPGALWGTNKARAYEVTGTDKANEFTPGNPAAFYENMRPEDIPKTEYDAIRAKLKERNKVVTPQEVLRIYKVSKGVK